MWVTDEYLEIFDNDLFIGKDGTQYPSNFPKNEILELLPVTLVQEPLIKQYQKLNYKIEFINEVYTQVWYITDWTQEEVDIFELDKLSISRADAKLLRAQEVEGIIVIVGTKTFDGDEVSQTRMARAIIGMQAANVPTINWTLSNNATTEVTLVELTTALIMSGQEQSRIWSLVY